MVPALASIQLALGQLASAKGFTRRNNGGQQKCGDQTFINSLVNGEVAPIAAVGPLATYGLTRTGPSRDRAKI